MNACEAAAVAVQPRRAGPGILSSVCLTVATELPVMSGGTQELVARVHIN